MHSSSILTKRIIQKRLGIQKESEAIQARAMQMPNQSKYTHQKNSIARGTHCNSNGVLWSCNPKIFYWRERSDTSSLLIVKVEFYLLLCV